MQIRIPRWVCNPQSAKRNLAQPRDLAHGVWQPPFILPPLLYFVNSRSYIMPVTICLWQALESLFYDYIQTLSHILTSKDHLAFSYIIYNEGLRSSKGGGGTL